jgi:hypothetical protein
MHEEDLTSPKFWYERLKNKDDELNRVSLELREVEGKLQGVDIIANKRQATIQQLETKISHMREEIHYLKEQN